MRDARKGHRKSVESVSFSPNFTQIVSCSADGTIRIWDATAGEVMRPVVSSPVLPNLHCLQSDLRFVSCSPDGWIRGSHQELILWVLPEWRDFVPLHPCILITGQSHIHFDLGHYVHGSEWIKCISNS
jgi:WD40 repeat protein